MESSDLMSNKCGCKHLLIIRPHVFLKKAKAALNSKGFSGFSDGRKGGMEKKKRKKNNLPIYRSKIQVIISKFRYWVILR